MTQRTKIFVRYVFVVLLGVFLHYAYELSGENPIIGLFALVRESVWEHLKLIFFPMLVLTLWDLFTRCKNNLCFLPARTIGILGGMGFTVVAFYTITGVIGSVIAWINILIFLLGVAVAFLVEKKACARCKNPGIFWSIIVLGIFIVLFFIFTQFPPEFGIFLPFME